jgi:UDP-glucose 4-epimerase
MTVVVTGSAGRIGGKVVAQLLEEGETVTGFDLRPAGISHPRYQEVIGTFDDQAAAERAISGAAAVLHLGAFMSWLPGDRDRLFAANVAGTRTIVEAAVRAKVGRFVFASSGEVYPETAPAYLPVDEKHPLAPRSYYGLTKLLGEELVAHAARADGLPTVVLRFSHTQDAAELLDPNSLFSGPRFFLHPKIKQQEAFGNKAAVDALRRVDDGRPALVLSCNAAGRPFRMHITESRDMVAGTLLALRADRAVGDVFNLGATEPVDFAVALPAMADLTGLPLHKVDLPGPGVYYTTSNRKIVETLGFTPKWTIDRMIAEAAEKWTATYGS